MAAFSVTPLVGIDLNNVVKASDIASGASTIPNLLGLEVWGSDGKRYVLGKANASITASTAVCTVSPTTFLVTATGGAYTSPAYAMVSGDYGFFGAASV